MAVNDFENQLQQSLRESEEKLDAATKSRLYEMRSETIGGLIAEERPATRRQTWLWPSAAVATLAVALLITIYPDRSLDTGTDLISELEDGPQQDMDLFEHLEFYEWLAAQEAS